MLDRFVLILMDPPVQVPYQQNLYGGLFAYARHLLQICCAGGKHLLQRAEAVNERIGNGLYIFAGNANGQQQFQQLVVRHSVAAALQISGTHTGSVPIPADFHLYPSRP